VQFLVQKWCNFILGQEIEVKISQYWSKSPRIRNQGPKSNGRIMDDRIIYRAEVTEFQVPGLKFKERHRATILGSHAKVAKSAKGRPVLQGGTELAEKNECGPEMV
jgi:hypothetical protein